MAASNISQIYELFWHDRIWLPPNVTWVDLENMNIQYASYASSTYLWYPIPFAFILILIRSLFTRHVSRPIGIAMNLRATPHRKAPQNDVLEEVFLQRKNLSDSQIHEKAVELNMTERQVERWLRTRKLQDRPTTLEKFSETGWRCFYYSLMFGYGMAVLWKKQWLWDIRYCWYHYPHHAVEGDVWWYYMIELTFYWSLTFSQFYDVKRKDFVEMFIHHITTILLMGLSWTCNLTRVGTLVLVIHDVADILLEAAKLCKYTNYQRTCDILFTSFAITWIVTRLGVYPTWILYSTTIEAPQIVEMFPAYYIFNALLAILLMLHVIWTYFILKIVYKAMYTGKTEKDTRSDSSDETLSSTDESINANTPSKKYIETKQKSSKATTGNGVQMNDEHHIQNNHEKIQ